MLINVKYNCQYFHSPFLLGLFLVFLNTSRVHPILVLASRLPLLATHHCLVQGRDHATGPTRQEAVASAVSHRLVQVSYLVAALIAELVLHHAQVEVLVVRVHPVLVPLRSEVVQSHLEVVVVYDLI